MQIGQALVEIDNPPQDVAPLLEVSWSLGEAKNMQL